MTFKIKGGVRTSLLLMVLTAVNSAAGQRPTTPAADLGEAWQPMAFDAARAGNGLPVSVRFDVLRRAAATPAVVTLPLSDGTTVRFTVQWSHADATEVAVAGPLVDGAGEASLTVVNDAVSGRIVVGDRTFLVRRLPGTAAHLVSELDQASLPHEAAPRTPPGARDHAAADADVAAGDSNAFVDLMILYTPAARAAIGGTSSMVAELTGATNNANLALANAGVAHRFRLVHYREVSYVETGDMNVTLDHLTFSGDGQLETVPTLRNQYRADVVTLFTTDPNFCGIGWMMGPSSISPSFAPYAFNVVNWTCANANLTMAHEIGHNMGLQHDKANAGSNAPAFPYAYGYGVNGLARDVMAYDCPSGCARRPIYSTPLFNFPGTGVPAGTVDEDTARALNGTSTAVANFRQSTCSVTVSSASANFPSAGGSGSVSVTTTDPFCTWTAASSNGAMLTVTGGSSGIGNGVVTYAVVANTAAASRRATLTIADKTVAIFQAGRNNMGDVDGDGRADIVVYRPSGGSWQLLRSATSFTAAATYAWGASTDLPVTGDFDGDGRNDLVVYRPATGHWFVLKSTTGFTTTMTYQWGGGSGDKPAPADYDGDGRTDFAVYRPSNGTWYVLTSSTGYTSGFGYAWGVSTDVPVPGDYDGDMRADIAVYRPASGHWFVLTSSSNYASYLIYQWGTAGDIAVPGNYDADTRTDIAIYRPSTGAWFLLYSSSGFSSGAVYGWGVSTDTPVPADYDGDGRTDIAVFRPSTAHWFILKSTSSFNAWDTYQWGTAGDIPVLRRQ
jgi:hypothetical protein